MRVGILADDLTGAADAAVQFVRAGWDTELRLSDDPGDATVVAVTTDSRAGDGVSAAALVEAAVRRFRAAGVDHLYKKIDSTLRGHIRVEIDAALRSWSDAPVAVVCPAFPALGRTVVQDELCVDNKSTGHSVAAVVGGRAASVNRGEPADVLAARILAGGPIVALDASTDDDLLHIAHAIAAIGPRAIPVGSAGLAAQLARVWRAMLRDQPVRSVIRTQEDKPATVVVIVTSMQDVSRRQALDLLNSGGLGLTPTARDVVADGEWARWSSRMLNECPPDAALVVLTAPADPLDDPRPMLVCERFAEFAVRLLARSKPGSVGFVVTGGDGARALAAALGATGIHLRSEVSAGVPAGTFVGGKADGAPVVTKAGGFGGADILRQAASALHAGLRS